MAGVASVMMLVLLSDVDVVDVLEELGAGAAHQPRQLVQSSRIRA